MESAGAKSSEHRAGATNAISDEAAMCDSDPGVFGLGLGAKKEGCALPEAVQNFAGEGVVVAGRVALAELAAAVADG